MIQRKPSKAKMFESTTLDPIVCHRFIHRFSRVIETVIKRVKSDRGSNPGGLCIRQLGDFVPFLNTEFECGDNTGGAGKGWPSLIPSGEERRVPCRVERCAASIYNTDVISHLAVTYRLFVFRYVGAITRLRDGNAQTRSLSPLFSPEIDIPRAQPREEFAWELLLFLSFFLVRGIRGSWPLLEIEIVVVCLDLHRMSIRIGVWNDTV